MIVLVILGILAAIAAPLIKRYVEDAERAAAEATLSSTEKAIGAYRAAHGEWPPAITPTLYQNEEPPTLPDGYAFDYNPATGEVALIETH
jgi:type II secretory pathway pseudopilin PulG